MNLSFGMMLETTFLTLLKTQMTLRMRTLLNTSLWLHLQLLINLILKNTRLRRLLPKTKQVLIQAIVFHSLRFCLNSVPPMKKKVILLSRELFHQRTTKSYCWQIQNMIWTFILGKMRFPTLLKKIMLIWFWMKTRPQQSNRARNHRIILVSFSTMWNYWQCLRSITNWFCKMFSTC